MTSTEITLEPEELEFLQKVFDSVREAKGIETHSSDANHIAAHIIELYQAGIRDPNELSNRLFG